MSSPSDSDSASISGAAPATSDQLHHLHILRSRLLASLASAGGSPFPPTPELQALLLPAGWDLCGSAHGESTIRAAALFASGLARGDYPLLLSRGWLRPPAAPAAGSSAREELLSAAWGEGMWDFCDHPEGPALLHEMEPWEHAGDVREALSGLLEGGGGGGGGGAGAAPPAPPPPLAARVNALLRLLGVPVSLGEGTRGGGRPCVEDSWESDFCDAGYAQPARGAVAARAAGAGGRLLSVRPLLLDRPPGHALAAPEGDDTGELERSVFSSPQQASFHGHAALLALGVAQLGAALRRADAQSPERAAAALEPLASLLTALKMLAQERLLAGLGPALAARAEVVAALLAGTDAAVAAAAGAGAPAPPPPPPASPPPAAPPAAGGRKRRQREGEGGAEGGGASTAAPPSPAPPTPPVGGAALVPEAQRFHAALALLLRAARCVTVTSRLWAVGASVASSAAARCDGVRRTAALRASLGLAVGDALAARLEGEAAAKRVADAALEEAVRAAAARSGGAHAGASARDLLDLVSVGDDVVTPLFNKRQAIAERVAWLEFGVAEAAAERGVGAAGEALARRVVAYAGLARLRLQASLQRAAFQAYLAFDGALLEVLASALEGAAALAGARANAVRARNDAASKLDAHRAFFGDGAPAREEALAAEAAAASAGVAAVDAALEGAAAVARDGGLAGALGALPLELRMTAAQRLARLLSGGGGGGEGGGGTDLRGSLNPLALAAQLRESAVAALALHAGAPPGAPPQRFKMPPALRHMDAWAVQPRVRLDVLRCVGWRAAADEGEVRAGFLGGAGAAPPTLPPAPFLPLLPQLLQPLVLGLSRKGGGGGGGEADGAAPTHVSVFDDGGLFMPLPPEELLEGDREALAAAAAEGAGEEGEEEGGEEKEEEEEEEKEEERAPPTAKRARGGDGGAVHHDARRGGGVARASAAGSAEGGGAAGEWCTIA
jgi:hypothetical protein